MKNHLTAVAVLQIGLGALGLLGAGFLWLVLSGAGFFSGDLRALAINSTLALLGSSFLVLVSLPGIVGGLGLLHGRPWARALLLVVAVFGPGPVHVLGAAERGREAGVRRHLTGGAGPQPGPPPAPPSAPAPDARAGRSAMSRAPARSSGRTGRPPRGPA